MYLNINADLDAYKTRSAQIQLWQGSISSGELLKCSLSDISRFKAISFKFYYSPSNTISGCIMPVELIQTSNVNLPFALNYYTYILSLIPTYLERGNIISIILADTQTVADSSIKLIGVYGVLK